jgi:hypothetical protein
LAIGDDSQEKKRYRIPKKAINEDLSHVTQAKEFVWV